MTITTQGETLLSVFGFLATVGLLGLAVAVILWAVLTGRQETARRVGWVAGAVATVYLVTLVGVGLASRPRILAAGEEKYFCELDCHVAYSVLSLNSLSRSAQHQGDRVWAVTVRTWFDENSISSRRPRDLPLWPGPRQVAVVDASGKRYPAVHEAQPGGEDGLGRPLRPGESYPTTLVFELPAGVDPVSLILADDIDVTPLLIGHERSPFHAPVLLALPPAA